MGLLSGQIVLGGIADQATRVIHLVHDGVACVDTRGAPNAFNLQAVADVDAGRADLHTHGAIDAISEAHRFVVGVLFPRATTLAATWIVRDD